MATAEAVLAQKILDNIAKHPDSFDMDNWFKRDDEREVLRATEEITCGTTLCVAGWAGHLSGYTLSHHLDDTGDVPRMLALASKDGVGRPLTAVAMKLLGLSNDSLFHTDEDGAREWLGNIAARST